MNENAQAAGPEIAPILNDEEFFQNFDTKLIEVHNKLVNAALPSVDIFPKKWSDNLEKSKGAFIIFLTEIKRKKIKSTAYRQNELLLLRDALNGEFYSSNDGHGNVCGVRMSEPKETVEFHLFRLRTVFGLYKSGKLSIPVDYAPFFRNDLHSHLEYIQYVLNFSESNQKRVTEIRAGEHFLSHGVPSAFLPTMLLEGKLSSRKSQIDRRGTSFDHTPIPNGSESEQSEVTFADDYLYGDIGMIYFIFPAGILLEGGSQFYAHDGVHVFDHEYAETNHCGYEVDLNSVPHFMVARAKDREHVRNLLGQTYGFENLEARMEAVFFTEVEAISSATREVLDLLWSEISAEAKKRFSQVLTDLGNYLIPSKNSLVAGQGRWSESKNLYTFAG